MLGCKSPSDPDFLPRPIEFLWFCGVSRGGGVEEMGIRAVPRLFLLISFSLIGMAYVRVGVKITRIWWVMII